MNAHRPSPAELAADIMALGARPAPLVARARTLLQILQPLVRFDAAHLDLLDPERQTVPSLARYGYPAQVERYLDTPARIHDLELAGILQRYRPQQLHELPVPPDEISAWVEYLRPAGFGNGIGVPLVTPDGRYLGLFSAHTEETAPLGDDACGVLAGLAPLIARAVDPLRTLTALASLVTDAVAGVIITRAGNTAPLPGLPGHPLLAPGSPVVREAVDCLESRDIHATFVTTAGRSGGYLKATVLASPEQPLGHLGGVVLLSPPGDLHGLTHRELTILGMLLAGWPQQRIAARLHLPAFALLTVLERIRVKFRARTRDTAVMRAAGMGLFLPPRLTRRQPR